MPEIPATARIGETLDVARLLNLSPGAVKLLDAELTAAGALVGKTRRGARLFDLDRVEAYARQRDANQASAAAAAIARARTLAEDYTFSTAVLDRLNITRDELRRLRNREIRAERVGDTWRYLIADVEKLAARLGRSAK